MCIIVADVAVADVAVVDGAVVVAADVVAVGAVVVFVLQKVIPCFNGRKSFKSLFWSFFD